MQAFSLETIAGCVNAGQCMFTSVGGIVEWNFGQKGFDPNNPEHIDAVFKKVPPFNFRVVEPREILPAAGSIPSEESGGIEYEMLMSRVAEIYDVKEVYIPLIQFCIKYHYQRSDFVSQTPNDTSDTLAYSRF